MPIYVHSADAARAKGGDKPKVAMGPMRLGATAAFFAYALRKGGMRTHFPSEVVEVADGEVLPLPGAPVVISMPGHSPGSIAVHVQFVDAVFVGDALTTRHVLTGRAGMQPAPFTDDPTLALESLDRLKTVDAGWVLPGHGMPWRGKPADVAEAVRRGARPVSRGSRRGPRRRGSA